MTELISKHLSLTPVAPMKTLESKARVLIVDDHPIVRQGLVQLLNCEPDFMVCAEAGNARKAMAAIAEAKPDVGVVDITLQGTNGIELIKNIVAQWPDFPLLVLSMHDESLYAERVLRAGAMGYITKQEATRNILLAIRRILAGNIYLNERIATHIIARLTAPAGSVALTPAEVLTDREFQVFELTGRGRNTRDIADELRVSSKTVETYRTRIRRKLNLQEGSSLLRCAIAWTHDE